MEHRIIQKNVSYLILRDVFLFLLVFVHTFSFYFPGFGGGRLSIVLAAGFVIWLVLLFRLIALSVKAGKDDYLKNAFQDEFFSAVAVKSGYYAFLGMLIACVMFFAVSIMQYNSLLALNLPAYLACEIIILCGVILNDASKLILLRK